MAGLYDNIDFRGRVIRQDTQSYRLLESDNLGMPGYFTIEPKTKIRLDFWATRVAKHLALNGAHVGANIEAAVQSNLSLAYKINNGIVRVNMKEGVVEIERNHANLDVVCADLIKLSVRGM